MMPRHFHVHKRVDSDDRHYADHLQSHLFIFHAQPMATVVADQDYPNPDQRDDEGSQSPDAGTDNDFQPIAM